MTNTNTEWTAKRDEKQAIWYVSRRVNGIKEGLGVTDAILATRPEIVPDYMKTAIATAIAAASSDAA